MLIGVPAETTAGETRVAVTPETAKKIMAQGHTVAVQAGAGVAASVTDAAYEAAGAQITDAAGALGAELVLKVIPMPADCNANGDIFGGWVMAQVDLAGAVLPARRVRGRMVTVAVNEFIFKQAVKVGDILSFFSRIVRVGRTSVTVKVEVYAERMRQQGRYVKVTQANLTYVAIDAQGKPRHIERKPD